MVVGVLPAGVVTVPQAALEARPVSVGAIEQRTASWPATPIQRWMQAHDEANPGSGYYVLPFTWSLPGRVDWAAFTGAMRVTCERYPILTAGLRRGPGGWVQQPQPFEAVPVQLQDATGLTGEEREACLRDAYDDSCRRPFRLTAEPPMRMRVVQLAEEFLVLGAAHVAVCDIESMAVVTADLWSAYRGLAAGTGVDLPPAAVRFAEYATRRAAQSPTDGDLQWWRDRLRGADLTCPLPVDLPEGLANPVGPTAYWKIGGPPTALAAHAIATRERCSEHAVLLAAFALVLSRRTGTTSVVVSSPYSLRRSPDLFGVVGPLTDVLWLPVPVADGGLGAQVRPAFREILGALSHPCPVDVLTRQVAADGGHAQGPNVQCVFYPPERVANPEWVVSSVAVKHTVPVPLLTGPLQSPFWLDLTIAGERNQPDTDFSLVYRTDLFRPGTARELAVELEQVILGAAPGNGGAGHA
jgi:Condensation domain